MPEVYKLLKLHVFVGGKSGVNEKYITSAVGRVEQTSNGLVETLDVVYVNVEDVRKNQLTLLQFASWLAAADIYILAY